MLDFSVVDEAIQQFHVELTKAEFQQLINELQAIHDSI